MKEKFDLSLVIACYNEGPIFEDSVKMVLSVLDQTDFSYEIIFVEDGSTDETGKKVKKILKDNPRRNMRAIFHTKNQGRGKTVSDGIMVAKGKVVGFIDIDLETPADYIPRFVNAILNGNDMAVAYRIYDFNLRSLMRWISTKAYIWLRDAMLRSDLKDSEAGYKFFNRTKILPIVKKCQDTGWFWDTEVLLRSKAAGLKIIDIPVVFIRKLDKKSTVRLWHDSWNYLQKLWQYRNKNI